MNTTLNLAFNPAMPHRYPIIIGSGVLGDSALLQAHIPQQQVCIVTNPTVAPLYLSRLKAAFADRQVIEVLVPDGERYKNLEQFGKVLDCLMQHRFGRDAVVVALGGGVVGDLAGYVAASYQRGMAFVQVPTTLLAQVDSSVGGKTGVNHPLGKNMIGAFHQPNAVFIDIDSLKTLPPREFSAGMAEVIKYGLINDYAFFQWLEGNIEALMAKDEALLMQAIAACCQNKANVVCADEKEHGARALLNLGHTFGHALESLTKYQQWKHGEAVAIGMRMAAELAVLRGELTQADCARVIGLLQAAHLPVDMGGVLTVDAVYDAMFLDKKVRRGKLRLIVFTALGVCRIADDVPEAQILAAITAAMGSKQ